MTSDEPANAKSGAPPSTTGAAVLLVDDEPENLRALEAALSPLNVRLVSAGSGHEALSLIEHHAFAVALVDVQMPVMDGFELSERLRRTQLGCALPVIFVTDVRRDEPFGRGGYGRSGGAEYISKPFDALLVRARVKAFVDLYEQREAAARGRLALRTRERDEAVRRLLAFERIASAALESTDLQGLLQELLGAFIEAADLADSAVIYLRAGDYLRVAAAVGEQEGSSVGAQLRLGAGFAGLVAEQLRPIDLAEEPADSQRVQSERARLARAPKALYGVPLLHEGELLGVAQIESSRASRFSDEERRLFLAVAERAALALSKQQRLTQLTEIFSAAPAYIAILAAETRRFVFVNPALRALFGEDPLGLELGQRVFGEQSRAAVEQLCRDGEGVEVEEVELQAANGAPLHARLSVQPLRGMNGQLDRLLLFATDITKQVRARRELEAAERERAALLERERALRQTAEEASTAKDEFLATVSHELRTPLAAILGWASLARSRPQADIERALTVIERNARAQARIVEDVLDFARLSKGQMRLALQSVELFDIVRAALESVRPAAEAKSIDIDVDLSLGGPLLADPERLQQVVWNLLSNAVKFSATETRIEVRAHGTESSAVLSVTDRGEGIAPEFLPHVFEAFRQAHGPNTRRHGGLGLGLSIVRKIVQAHGGTIEAESAGLGQGATFRVKLPLDHAGASESDPALADSPRL